MKKLIVRLLIALVVVVVLGVMAAGLFLDKAIKGAVETLGPKLTKVEMKLDSVQLSFLSGSGTIKGFMMGNPQGYKSPSAIRVGEAHLALKPGSLFSDKIVVQSVRLHAPEITYETNLKKSNLSQILENVQEAAGGEKPSSKQEPAPPPAGKKAKKLEVDEFIITGGKVNVSVTGLVNGSATVPLPDIHLQGLGTGPDGITAAELTQRIIQAIEDAAAKAAPGAITDLKKTANDALKSLSDTGSNTVQSVTKGLNDLLKKK